MRFAPSLPAGRAGVGKVTNTPVHDNLQSVTNRGKQDSISTMKSFQIELSSKYKKDSPQMDTD